MNTYCTYIKVTIEKFVGNTDMFFKGSTKNSVAERLGNYIDPKSKLMEKFMSSDVHELVLSPELYVSTYFRIRYKRGCLGNPTYSNNYEGDFIKYPREEGYCTVCFSILPISFIGSL